MKWLIELWKNTNLSLRRRCNTLELENEKLEEIIKNELFKDFMEKRKEIENLESYAKEILRLRKIVKKLKEENLELRSALNKKAKRKEILNVGKEVKSDKCRSKQLLGAN